MKKYKIIFAELDGTLTDTISDKTSIKSFWDVKFRFEVLEKIKQLAPERVLIASNQGKIEGDCLNAFNIRVQYVCMAIRMYCNCKCSGSCCLTDNKESPDRKPNTGMLKGLCREIEDDINNIKSVSLMIGNTGDDKKCAENFGIDYLNVEDFVNNGHEWVD